MFLLNWHSERRQMCVNVRGGGERRYFVCGKKKKKNRDFKHLFQWLVPEWLNEYETDWKKKQTACQEIYIYIYIYIYISVVHLNGIVAIRFFAREREITLTWRQRKLWRHFGNFWGLSSSKFRIFLQTCASTVLRQTFRKTWQNDLLNLPHIICVNSWHKFKQDPRYNLPLTIDYRHLFYFRKRGPMGDTGRGRGLGWWRPVSEGFFWQNSPAAPSSGETRSSTQRHITTLIFHV